MNSPPPPSPPPSSFAMAPKSPKHSSIVSDGLLFFGGAAVALLIFTTFYSLLSPSLSPSSPFHPLTRLPPTPSPTHPNLHLDPSSAPSFYDDPFLSFTVTGDPISDWDQKRQSWLQSHPSFLTRPNKILMLSGSQPGPCRNPIGDHLLLRFYKNKADYCRLHDIDLFYNTALLQPEMFSFWAKIPVVRAAMVAHPEAEWIWWVDSDACITDMEFELPLEKYDSFNLILHGWPRLVYEARSWTSLNAGVFLMRNCQWSLDFIDLWSKMGPQSPEYERWGSVQRSIFKDKLYAESDDQTGIAYLLLKEKEKWGDKTYLESSFYFEGYWVEIVNKLEKIEEEYLEIERKVKGLRRRRAEKVSMARGRLREEFLEGEGLKSGVNGWRRPFITHFTGCQPCSGDHNKLYSGENCFDGMQKALNFADNQVLRSYGFRHERLVNSTGVRPLPFDFPAAD